MEKEQMLILIVCGIVIAATLCLAGLSLYYEHAIDKCNSYYQEIISDLREKPAFMPTLSVNLSIASD